MPPSTTVSEPVANELSSEARKRAAAASSSGCASLSIIVRARSPENDAGFERTALDAPLERNREPDDITAAALHLASDESAVVTGIELLVDGG